MNTRLATPPTPPTPATIAGVVLEEVCTECVGAGWVSNPDWQAWHEAGQPAGKEPRDETGLERDGLAPEEWMCPECEGNRVRTTEDGRLLLAFMERWFDVRRR